MKQYKDLLDNKELNEKKEIIHFIPNNCFDFKLLKQNITKKLVNNLESILFEKGILKKYFNKINLNLNEYITLNYDDYLLLFISDDKYYEDEREESSYQMFYYKIEITNKKLIDIGKICLMKQKNKKRFIDFIINDINISIRNEFIYLFYICEYSDQYYLKFQIYNKYTMSNIKNGDIELKNNFIPIRLFNDNEFLYCIAEDKQTLKIKKCDNFIYQKYKKCCFRLFGNDLIYYTEIKYILSYEMFNNLCINDYLFLYNTDNQRYYIAQIIENKSEDILFNIYETSKNSENIKFIRICYYDNRFIITNIRDKILYFDMTSKDFNNFMDKGIALLPFNSNSSIDEYPDNLYEILIQKYSSFLNLCGNFELINAEKEKNLIKYPFSFCCNFDKNILNFVINNIMEDDNFDINKMNYIIILKQIICSLYNVEILDEEIIKKLIPYFKKLILNIINSDNKAMLYKLLNEIMEISLYIKDDTIIEIDDIKFALDKDYTNIDTKSKFLLLEFVLNQNRTKNTKELCKLYKYIIQLEKEYLTDIFTNKSIDLSNYYLIKKFMINASESIFKRVKYIQNDLISLIPDLLVNIQLIMNLYQKNSKNENNFINEFSFLYYSFNFRTFFFIIEYILANKIFLGKKEYIIPIYKTLLILDSNNFKYNECFDLDNIIEITNNSLKDEERENNNYYYSSETKIVNIKLKKLTDIIIRTNLLTENEFKQLNTYIKITIISGRDKIPIKLYQDKENIYHDTLEIEISFSDIRNNDINDFILNIMPLKNKYLFELYKNNKDYKIMSLIENSLIQYLLFLFDDIKSQIDIYNDNKIIKNYRK